MKTLVFNLALAGRFKTLRPCPLARLIGMPASSPPAVAQRLASMCGERGLPYQNPFPWQAGLLVGHSISLTSQPRALKPRLRNTDLCISPRKTNYFSLCYRFSPPMCIIIVNPHPTHFFLRRSNLHTSPVCYFIRRTSAASASRTNGHRI